MAFGKIHGRENVRRPVRDSGIGVNESRVYVYVHTHLSHVENIPGTKQHAQAAETIKADNLNT